MPHRFRKHYTVAEARALLPQVRSWLERLGQLRGALAKHDERLVALRTQANDLGGEVVIAWVRVMADLQGVLLEFHQRDIQVKDLDRGLLDFPALMDGKEVFLCWEQEEEDIGFWHDLDAGYAGRERLEE